MVPGAEESDRDGGQLNRLGGARDVAHSVPNRARAGIPDCVEVSRDFGRI